MAAKKPSERTVKRATQRASAKRTGRAASAAVKAVSTVLHTPQWQTACRDWQTRVRNRTPLTPCPPLWQDQADEGIAYFSNLAMVDLGQKDDGTYHTFGEVSPEWVTDFVGAVFGCYCDVPEHPMRGRRLMKEFFMLISKKNSKSTIAAGIMLTALLLNWRDEAEFIILSPTKEIADNSFKPMAAAVRADPELAELLHVQEHYRTITHRATRATIKVVAADSATVSGKKAVGVLIDELHEFGKLANASQIFTEATGGLMSRPEGFVIYLTTQSSQPPAGVFKEKLEYARKVRDGLIVDPLFYPIIYEFPPDMIESKAYLDPANFYVTNPNMGRSVDEATLIRTIQSARDTSKAKLLDVMAKHLNIEVGANLGDDSWAGAEPWTESPKIENASLDYILAHSEVIVAGIDGGGLDDLYGLNVMGRHKVTKRWLSWEHAYAHPIVLKRRQEIAPRLEDFAKSGDLTIVEHIGEDVELICGILMRLHRARLLHAVGFDPNSLGGLLAELDAAGMPEDKCFRVNQGWKLAASIKTAERKLAEGIIEHGHRPLMNWCVGNAKVEATKNAIVITKAKSGTAKIDPLMAFFNSVELMMAEPPAMIVTHDFSRMELIG